MTYMTQTICGAERRPGLTQRIRRAYGVWKQRQALRALDDAALEDIGITRAQAIAEADRPVWDAPISWRH